MCDNDPVMIKITRNDPDLVRRKQWFLEQPGCRWQKYLSGDDRKSVLQISRKGVFLESGNLRLSFHPSMALLRIINIFKNISDRYLEATSLQPGDTLLDATLGLGTDALIGAWAVGAHGRIIGLENSPLVAAIVKDGLIHFAQDPVPTVQTELKQQAWNTLALAADRIEVVWADHLDFLKQQPDFSVDVIYFDPMFRHTRVQSASIQPLHLWSDSRPLSRETVKEACRVARRRVVLKERKDSVEFQRLGFKVLPGGKYSQVDYGMISV